MNTNRNLHPLRLVFMVVAMAMLTTPVIAESQPRPQVELTTALGRFIVELYPDQAPRSAQHFLELVKHNTYTNSSFYAAIRPDTYPIIEAAPNQLASVRPGGVLVGGILRSAADSEAQQAAIAGIVHEDTRTTGLAHTHGALSWGRYPGKQASSEFLITVGVQPDFDHGGGINADGKGYAVFGRVISGMDIVETILQQPTKGTVDKHAQIAFYKFAQGVTPSEEEKALMDKSPLTPNIGILRAAILTNDASRTAVQRTENATHVPSVQ